jgi:GNAT superfamily N-acetyltransferase
MPIRMAVDADVPEVRRCVIDAYAVYADRLERPPAPVRDDHAAQVREGLVHVESEGSVRGLIVLRTNPDHLFVVNLAVRPELQGQGIGSRLLDFAEGRARRLGLGEVRLATNERMTENLRYYSARGYIETGRGMEDGYARVFLTKRLGSSP